MIPTVDKLCTSSSQNGQDILQMFDDKCLKIVSGADVTGQFCLNDFAFPSDGHLCLSIDLAMDGGEKIIFDNAILSVASPYEELKSEKAYIRGIMLKITYPAKDDNGDTIKLVDKNVELWIEDAEALTWKKLPLYNLFMLFTNPKSNDPTTLINRIKIVNPNKLYKLKVIGLIIYGNAE